MLQKTIAILVYVFEELFEVYQASENRYMIYIFLNSVPTYIHPAKVFIGFICTFRPNGSHNLEFYSMQKSTIFNFYFFKE